MSRLDPRPWVADALTLSNGVFGFLSILTWSIELGPLSPLDDSIVAAAYIGLGMVADGLDGIVARVWGSTGLGNALDSMSDFLTFCVAPAVFLLEAVNAPRGTGLGAITAVVAVAFIIAGMLRLARHQEDQAPGTPHFAGLPAPWSGATLVVLLLLDVPAGLALVSAALLGALNVSKVPYPKTRGALTKVALAILIVALLVIGGLILLGGARQVILVLAAAIAVTMVVIGPFVAARVS
ncbi:MAG: CDP-alcohol phosphatidyltransferase family protein [Candidatus Thermoplasmatota archaeon]|nr:CDP-alcohol phosphatidyltransferase family protein [Candidatus Thermoplasmatota archaeon]